MMLDDTGRSSEANVVPFAKEAQVNPTAGNPLIARKQRTFVEAVQAHQPGRPVLVQPLRRLAQQKTTWRPLSEVQPTEELWTRSIAINEVVFDFDTHDWRALRATADRVTSVLDLLGARYHLAMTGGKGVHIHTWLDLKSIKAPAATLLRAKKVDVCPFSSMREEFAEAVLDGAEVPRGQRWASEGGIIDKLKVRWSAARKGSMVREFGCRGSRGFRKALVTHLPDEFGGVPFRIPTVPTAAYAAPEALARRIVRRIESDVQQATAARDAPPKCLDGVGLEDVPCATRTMGGISPGARHVAHVNLVVTCYRLGLTEEEALVALGKAVEKHGLSEGDTPEKLVRQVYSGRWRAPENLACPSPLVPGLCDPNACALSRHLSFS